MMQNERPAKIILPQAPSRPPRELLELGRVAAGIPLEAVEEKQRSELLELLTAPGRYALQVCDDSMSEAGILAGDFVVVQSQLRARSGDIVVALLDNEQVILKRIRYAPPNRVRLLCDNPAGEELVVDDSRIVIQGRVIGQVRRYR
jgi:repressor LexA